MTILLKNGHVVDYVNGFEGKKDILKRTALSVRSAITLNATIRTQGW